MEIGVVIVGGGVGGAQAAIALRDQGYTGTILIVCGEPELPYDRTALSKGYLLGQVSFKRMLLRTNDFWASKNIQFLYSTRAVEVDADAHELRLDNGQTLFFGKLIWAAGGSPRRLQCLGHDLAGIHYMRNRADIDALIADLSMATRVAIIGGGYVGLEAAAALKQLGKDVVLLESQDLLLSRVSGTLISTFFTEEHIRRGVHIKTCAQVVALLGRQGRVSQVQLASGEILEADAVVVGIGITPNVGPLISAGAEGSNGVMVDERCRTTLPEIYAIGDCALHANRYAGEIPIRLECIQNATDQASVAAKDIVGKPASNCTIPWFWSSQYDLKLQTIGIVAGHDKFFTRTCAEGNLLAVIYLRDQTVVAVDCLNSTKSFVEGRKLIGKPYTHECLTAFPGGNIATAQ